MPLRIASAGTNASYDHPPHTGMLEVAKSRGYAVENYRSKPLQDREVRAAFRLLVMDELLLRQVQMRCDADKNSKIKLLSEYSSFFYQREIVYPATCAARDFILMFDRIEDACLGLWKSLTDRAAALE